MKKIALILFIYIQIVNASCAKFLHRFETNSEQWKEHVLIWDSINTKQWQNFIDKRKYDSALMYLNTLNSAELSKEIALQILKHEAKTFEAASLFKNAANSYFKAYELYKFNIDSLAWDNLFNSMVNNSKANQHKENQKLFDLAQKHLQKEGNPLMIARFLNLKSILYRKLQFTKDAMAFVDSAIQINKKYKKEPELSVNYTSKAKIFFQKKDYNQALIYFKLAYETGLKMKTTRKILKNKLNLASALQAVNKNTEARLILDEILTGKLSDKASDKVKAASYFNYGTIHMIGLNWEQAFIKFDSAIHIAEKIRDFNILKKTYTEKARIYAHLKEFEKSYKFARIVSMYKDSLNQDKLVQMITEVELNNSYLQNEQLKRESELKESVAREQSKKFIAVLILIFLIFSVLLFRYRSKNKFLQKIFSRSLKSLKSKHVDYMQIHSEIDRMKSINDSLKKDMNRAVFILQENVEVYTKLSKLFDKSPDIPKNLKDMGATVNNMCTLMKETDMINEHPENNEVDLRSRIKQEFPDLTRTEIKLCMLIRLDMSTKEIASYTNTATGSVEVAKYRLRKKLGYESMGELMKRLNEV